MSSLRRCEPAEDAVTRSAPSKVAAVVAALSGKNNVWDDDGFVQVEKRCVVDNESLTEHRRGFTQDSGLDGRRWGRQVVQSTEYNKDKYRPGITVRYVGRQCRVKIAST